MNDLNAEIVNTIKSIINIPERPSLMKTYGHLMSSPSPSLHDINQLLIQFPPIESKLLSAINSYAFGLKSRIDTVNKALEKLGLISVNNILTGLFIDDSLVIDSSAFSQAAMFIGRSAHSQMAVDNLYCLASLIYAGLELDKQIKNTSLDSSKPYHFTVVCRVLSEHWQLNQEYDQIFHLLSEPSAYNLPQFANLTREFQLNLAALSLSLCCLCEEESHEVFTDYVDNKAESLSILGLTDVDFLELKDRYNQQIK